MGIELILRKTIISNVKFPLLHCLVVGGVIAIGSIPAAAQSPDDEGIIRVTDISSNIEPIAEGGQGYCPNCPNGGGESYGETCPHGHAHGHCSHCSGKFSSAMKKTLDWFNPHGMCTHSPDHGFCPPVKRPIYRSPVVYRKSFPDSWTGAPGAGLPQQRVPSVYMPTDTTQLGYYYQHAPYWLPNANAIPSAPRPADWHSTVCNSGLSGHPSGVILGTAPEVAPFAPNAIGTEPTPAIIQEQAGVLQGSASAPTSGLERSAFSPTLLPIQ